MDAKNLKRAIANPHACLTPRLAARDPTSVTDQPSLPIAARKAWHIALQRQSLVAASHKGRPTASTFNPLTELIETRKYSSEE